MKTSLDERGIILILTLMIMTAMTAIVVAFLSLTSTQLKGSAYDFARTQALTLAEAGHHKAVWNLKTPAGSGGQGENWTTAGTTENLGSGSYTVVVVRWDFSLAANGSVASASSTNPGDVAANAIDGNNATYWESAGKPVPGNPENIVVTFPYNLTLNKVRFLVPAGSDQQAPKDYTWQVSSDNVNYTTVVSVNNNQSLDVTDTFAAASNVRYLKLDVSKVKGAAEGVRIATLEAIGSKITSTGTVDVLTRTLSQTVVADDATETAADQKDWNQL